MMKGLKKRIKKSDVISCHSQREIISLNPFKIR